MNNSLTSFRFFAFFAVFLFHQLVFPTGYLGVQAFFVLSGFLLTPILLQTKTGMSTRNYFVSFYGRRVLRIFPVYYFYLLLVVVLTAWIYFPQMKSDLPVINRFYHQLPWALTYTYNLFHASDSFKHTYLLTHFWSLAIEEQFYLVWPVVIYLLPEKKLKMFLLGVMLAGPVVRGLTGCLVHAGTLSWLGDDAGLVVYVSPFSHFDAFAAGGFFALYGRAYSGRTLLGLAMLIIAGGIASAAARGDGFDWIGWGYANFMNNGYTYIWGYSLFNVFFAGCLFTLGQRNPTDSWLVAPWLVYLGSISYGLYVFHNAFIWLVAYLLPDLSLFPSLSLVFILTLAASALSYRWLERPCLQLKDRFFSGKPTL